MAFATIGEYRHAVEVAKGAPIVTQRISFDGTAGTSAPFNAETRHIRVCADAACHFVMGDGVTATTNNEHMAAESTEYFGPDKERGWVMSFIAR